MANFGDSINSWSYVLQTNCTTIDIEKYFKDRLQDTLLIAEKINQKNREIEKLKGENFNILTILDMRENELKTHSAFIAELLNPKGSHNLKSAFLSLFVDLLHKKKGEDTCLIFILRYEIQSGLY